MSLHRRHRWIALILAVQLGKATGMVAFPPETQESEVG